VLGTSLLSPVTCPGDNGVSPFNPNVAAIVDFLGYGSAANCYEGAGPPTVSGTNSNARSVIRAVSCRGYECELSGTFSKPGYRARPARIHCDRHEALARESGTQTNLRRRA
jgi:hypothetical protein